MTLPFLLGATTLPLSGSSNCVNAHNVMHPAANSLGASARLDMPFHQDADAYKQIVDISKDCISVLKSEFTFTAQLIHSIAVAA